MTTTMIPAIHLIGNPNAKNNLVALDAGIQFIPGIMQAIPVHDDIKLSIYNRRSLDTDLNDKNLQEEIENLEKTEDKTIYLNNLQSLYQKFSANSFSYNRIQTKKQLIPGVGVDGAGFHPTIFPDENLAINKIKEVAEDNAKWDALENDDDEILKESVKNTCFWQACNLSQFPIGTPVQVCSAVIQLLSPVKDPMSAKPNVEFQNIMTGTEFIKIRPEIAGLQYFIDGNVMDIEDKRRIIHGVRDFGNQKFIRFGQNGNIDDRGTILPKPYEIYLITDADYTTSSPIITNLGAPNSGIVQFQLLHSSSLKPDEAKIINKDLRDNYLKKVIIDSPSTDKREIRGVLLFLFTIFFEYACYIYNLYEEKLISKLNKKTSREVIDQLKRANVMMIGNFILLINYSLIRKFNIKDENGVLFSPQNFISVQQVDAKTDSPPNNIKAENTLSNVIARIHSDKIKGDLKTKKNTIRVFFGDSKMYNNFQIDENEFKPDNFPLVFDTNKLVEPIATGLDTDTFIDVSYTRSIKRLTEFLLQNNKGEIPKFISATSKAEIIITVGAPMQNDEIFQKTFEVLESYYTYIKSSKQVYLQFAKLKIDIFRSGFPSETVREWYIDFLKKFNIIFTSYKIPQRQYIELMKLILFIMNKYKKYRKTELTYLKDKTSYENNSRKDYGNRMGDLSRELYRAILSVRAGLSAEMLMTIAKLSYDIFVDRNPGTSSNFIVDLKNQRDIFDAEINIETQKILQKQQLQIQSKFGKGSLQIGQQFTGLVGPGNIPQPPPQFLQMFSGILQPGSMMPSSYTGAPGSAGKVNISLENRLKVENLKFWQDLRTIFSGRTLFLPVVKLNSRKIFNNSEFYLINILSSMIFNKLSAIQISENGVVSRQAIDSKLLNNGYILLTVNKVDLANPNSWRCVNYTNISKLRRTNGVFKDIKKVRGLFFNIIANNLTLTEILNLSIPSGSNISNGLVKYCSNVLKKELPNCNILISRQQFAQTVQPKMNSLTGTSGIDLSSGTAYYEHGPYVQSRNSDIVVR